MNLINKIQEIIKEFIIEKYFNYLDIEQILFIQNIALNNVICDIYNNNIKNIKSIIREKLKKDMGDEYLSGTIENIIFDIFQDHKININRIIVEIEKYQNDNFIEINKTIGEDGLGLNINIEENFCLINNIKDSFIKDSFIKDNDFVTKETIEKYKYLYSINNIILNKCDNILEILKENIIENSVIKLGLYELKL